MIRLGLVGILLTALVSIATAATNIEDCTQEDVWMSGGDLRSFTTIKKSFTECFEACTRRPTCAAFSYRTTDGKCYLKSSTAKAKSTKRYNSALMSCVTGTSRDETSDFVNVALLDNVTAKQSSTKSGLGAGLAIDGDTNTRYDLKSCSWTSSSRHNWIEIDLQKAYQIDHIVIYGRSDSKSSGAGTLDNVKLLIGDQICDTLEDTESTPTVGKTYNCGGDASRLVGRTVVLENWGERISVCEIQIMVHKDLVSGDALPTPASSETSGQVVGDFYNVAYKKPITTSSEHWGKKKEYAVDGWTIQDSDDNTCSVTDDGRLEEFMSIDLGRVFQIDHIRVYGDKKKNSEDLNGIRVAIGDNICGRLTATTSGVVDLSCDKNMMAGQVVRLYNRKEHMILCEVQVMVKMADIDVVPDNTFYWPGEKGEELTNVALSRDAVATQSSTMSSYAASRAIDGFNSGNMGYNSVTHTERSGNMWWEVDLGRVYNIQSINIYGRTDCCDDRIDGARVFVGKAEVGTLSTPAKASDVMKIVVGGVAARRVRVELLNEYLSLAEVKVYVNNDDVMGDVAPTVQERWENVARNRPATQSSDISSSYTAGNAVDGLPNSTDLNDKSCTHTKYDMLAWWQVDLGEKFYIDHIAVSGRNSNQDRLDGATIEIDGRTVAGFGTVGKREYFTFNLGGLEGQVVKVIVKNEYLTLCEVQVMVDHEFSPDESTIEPIKSSAKNYALASGGAVASASSVLYGGEARFAIDGDASADFFQGSCTFAGPVQNNNWVKVDLGQTQNIESVTVYPRLDNYGYECLDGAVVRVGEHVCGTVEWEGDKLYYEFDCGSASGSEVTVSKEGWLSVCEIVIHKA